MSADLAALRARIDAVDARLVAVLAEREAVLAEVVEAKLASGAPARDEAREREIVNRAPAGYVRGCYADVVARSRRLVEAACAARR